MTEEFAERKTRLINEVVRDIKTQFESAGLDSPELDARLIVQGILGLTRGELFMHDQRLVSKVEEAALSRAVRRRLKREPVSRILGARAFWKYDFKVTEHTLDPRSDSETIIDIALEFMPSGGKRSLRLLDLGTGTGCLLLSLLMEWPTSLGMGVDISAAAVRTAETNARRLKLAKRAAFFTTSWHDFNPRDKFDIIVSNPPYIADSEKPSLAPEVAKYDPPIALFGGPDGLTAYRELGPLVRQWLKPGGLALFEIGYQQAAAVKDILAKAKLHVVETRRDLAGNDRVVVATIKK